MRLWQSSGIVALGVALLKAAQEASGYHNTTVSGVLWVLLGLLVLVVLLDLIEPDFWKLKMLMHDAAKLLYSRLRKKDQSYLIEGFGGGNHDSLLGVTQQYIVQSSAIIYGKRAPGVLHEKIDKGEFKGLMFRDGGSVLTHYGEKKPIYTDVCVNRWSLWWAGRGLAKQFKEYADQQGKE